MVDVGDVFYRLVVRSFVALFMLLGLRITVRGVENVPRHGPAVLAINHTSYLDFALVGHAVARRSRLVRFMAKAATFDSHLTGPAMRTMRHIPVDRSRGAAAYRRATRKLTDGEVVGLFPEATISRSWTLKPFKLGAAALCVDVGVPLLPVVVWGGHRVLTVDGRWSLRRGRAVTVHVGPAVVPAPGATVAEVDALLRAELAALLDLVQRTHPVDPSDDGDRWWLPAHLGGAAPNPETAAVLDAAGLARGDTRATPRDRLGAARGRRPARRR